MTIHNKRHKKQILQEASILLEYDRIKRRTKPQDKALWEYVESMYVGTLLTEERLHEQKAIVGWLKTLGKGATDKVKGWLDKHLKGEDEKLAKDVTKEIKGTSEEGKIKTLLKKGDWAKAFKVGMKWMDDMSKEDDVFPGPKDGGIGRFLKSKEEGQNLQERKGEKEDCSIYPTASIGNIGCHWRNTKVWGKTLIVAFMLVAINFSAVPLDSVEADVVDNKAKTEWSQMAQDLAGDNPEGVGAHKIGDKSVQASGFDSGVQFELGSSQLDDAGEKQVKSIAQDYVKLIKGAIESGDTINGIDIEVKGGASNTGDGWDKDNAREGSLSQNRSIAFADQLNTQLQALGTAADISPEIIDNISFSVDGMESNELGASEKVDSGEKDDNQISATKINIDTTPQQTDDGPGVDIDVNQPVVAKFNAGSPEGKDKEPFNPGTARGSRNLEYRDMLYLGGIDPIPVTFGDYKSDSDMGRVDWRDIDIQGNKFLEDQQKMAVWITNTRKSKFPILKRTKNALQGIIDIEFDGAKYLGNVGPKYDPSTTTPLTQKRTMGKRGPNKFVPDTEKGGYMGNPALTEAKGELPPEFIKQPEIPANIKSLQGNTTALWKYMLGKKAIGDLITSQVAAEFNKNMKEYLEQLDLMYGKSGTRGDVNFRFRRNPNYEGSAYSTIPTTWNKKISSDDTEPISGGTTLVNPEVLPFVQDYTGDYTQGMGGDTLIGSAPYNPEDWRNLQEEIKRIKTLMI
tara:strand:- start:4393 stop:6612 length:2220 start_codon:yes stop_codon:yes gene_type:complete